MNLNLQASRKVYWSRIHAIRAERNCTTAEAKRLYSQNGHADGGGQAEEVSPESLTTLALQKAKEVESKITEHETALTQLRSDLYRWQKVGASLSEETMPMAEEISSA